MREFHVLTVPVLNRAGDPHWNGADHTQAAEIVASQLPEWGWFERYKARHATR